MNARIKIMIAFFCIFTFLIIGPGCKDEIKPGPRAPDFTLQNLSGKTITLSEYRGKIVILDFWASWCDPCKWTIPELVKVYDKYRDKGLVVFGISLDNPQVTSAEYLRAFKNRYKIQYSILRYNNRVVIDYFGYQPPPLPTLMLIDHEGRIAEIIVGFQPGAVERAVAKLF
jgi:cytochrome c biogenesis protein CcmG/thiol:disulfide interchange protein DsbE